MNDGREHGGNGQNVKRKPVSTAVGAILVAAAAAAAAAAPAPLHAHIELEASTPAPGEILAEAPSRLQLRFSGYIEERYTRVALIGPGGEEVQTGPIVFVDGSDRVFQVMLPPLRRQGRYTVRWRTAGADGHVLEGTWSFMLRTRSGAGDMPILARPGTQPGAPVAPAPIAPGAGQDEDAMGQGHAQMGHGSAAPAPASGPADVLGRFLQFVALVMILGALTFRGLLLPRLAMSDPARVGMRRRAWRALAFGALLLFVAALLRLWLQSVALHGRGDAADAELLSLMLTRTVWGKAWLLQALLFTLLGFAVAWARPPRDGPALALAVLAAIGLSAVPGLSGHAVGTGGSPYLPVVNDALHVIAGGAWIGTLFVLSAFALPVMLRPVDRRPSSAAEAADVEPAEAMTSADPSAAADAIDTFSPVALGAAGLVLATGLINALFHFDEVSQLLTTSYGRALLLKVGAVGLVLLAGFINWRVVRPRLRSEGGIRRLRLSATAELVFAGLVLAATAVLTGLPRP